MFSFTCLASLIYFNFYKSFAVSSHPYFLIHGANTWIYNIFQYHRINALCSLNLFIGFHEMNLIASKPGNWFWLCSAYICAVYISLSILFILHNFRISWLRTVSPFSDIKVCIKNSSQYANRNHLIYQRDLCMTSKTSRKLICSTTINLSMPNVIWPYEKHKTWQLNQNYWVTL